MSPAEEHPQPDARRDQPDVLRLDDRAVTVLAHPLRSRLLGVLRVNGPATATELARHLDTNTGATSYHLRMLAEVGLVEDTGEGVGKRREWRASTSHHSWNPSDFAGHPDTAAALDWLQRNAIRQFVERAERWEDASGGWDADWVDAMGMSDTVVTVTAAAAVAMKDEIAAIIDRYRHAEGSVASAHEHAEERVIVTLHLAPLAAAVADAHR